jgi:hypothetical protein
VKEPLAHTEWEAPYSWSEHYGEKIDLLHLPGMKPKISTLQPSHCNYYAFMAPGCFQTLQNTGGSGSVNKIYILLHTQAGTLL